PTMVPLYVAGEGVVVAPRSLPTRRSSDLFPGFGPNHGFNAVLGGVPAGVHTVCAFGINVGPGVNNAVGCRSVVVLSGSPFGSLEFGGGRAWTAAADAWRIHSAAAATHQAR